MTEGKFRFAIDRGGTFTDIWAQSPSGKVTVMKLLSEDPQNYKDAPREGMRRILEQETGSTVAADVPIDVSQIEWIRMGTTVATNALLERKGTRMALAITKGFKDLLHIGNQARPSIFDLEISSPDQLYEDVIQVDERLVLQNDKCEIRKKCPVVEGKTKEKYTAKATNCPDRWVAFEGSCYLFGHDLIYFTEAEDYCRNHTASLVHVETKAENMFLRDFLRDFKLSDYWMGMTDETVEGVWKWYGTNEIVEYFDWGPSEPQNSHNEDCAVFGDTIDYTWADVVCASNRKALCEMLSEDVNIIG